MRSSCTTRLRHADTGESRLIDTGDVDAARLAVVDAEPSDDLGAAVWSCDGSDILAFGLRPLGALSGDPVATDLSEDTFLYGVGAC